MQIWESATVKFQIKNAYQVHDRFKSFKLKRCSMNHDGAQSRALLFFFNWSMVAKQNTKLPFSLIQLFKIGDCSQLRNKINSMK